VNVSRCCLHTAQGPSLHDHDFCSYNDTSAMLYRNDTSAMLYRYDTSAMLYRYDTSAMLYRYDTSAMLYRYVLRILKLLHPG